MDQTIIEVAPGPPVAPGDPVVLLGRQDGQVITAQEWADRLDTIPYEVVCGFSVRLPRVQRDAGATEHVARPVTATA
jgi:alanine racemase